MTISVLGSAPFAGTIPLSREIFTANGGVHHIERLGLKSTEVSALIVSGDFGHEAPHPVPDLVSRNAPYKKILLRESLRGLDHSESNHLVAHLAKRVELLSYTKMLELYTSEINYSRLLATALKPKNFLNSGLCFLQAIKHKGKKERLASTIISANGNKVSSGVLAAMVASAIAEPEEKIHLFGITASRNEYAYDLNYDRLTRTQRGHQSPHLVPDLKILSAMSGSAARKLVIHDKGLEEAVRSFRA